MEMVVKKVIRRQKEARNNLDSNELEIVSISEEVQNVNGDDRQKEANPNFDIGIPSAFVFDEDRRYTKEDLKYNFFALKWSTWLKVSPFGAEENSKVFPGFRKGHKKRWQNGISLGWFSFAFIRVLVGYWSLAHFVMTQNSEENLGRITVLIFMCISGSLLLYAIYSDVVQVVTFGPFLFSVFKYLDDSDVKVEQKKSGPKKFGFGFQFGRHTLKELWVIHLPFFVYSMSVMMPFLIAFDPSFPFLLVSLTRPEISFSFFACAAVDTVALAYFVMIIHLAFYVFMGMHRIQEETKLTLKNLKIKNESSSTTKIEDDKEKSIKLQKALKSLGLLYIWTHFFNKSLSSTVYVIKLIALTASISGGFGFIKMMEVANVPYAGIFGLAFIEGIILYNLIFGRAFEIPEKVEELKSEIRQQSFKLFKNKNSLERKYVEKYLRSIPWLGVQDGVYKMERMTCVNFVCFVTEQITDLVLTY